MSYREPGTASGVPGPSVEVHLHRLDGTIEVFVVRPGDEDYPFYHHAARMDGKLEEAEEMSAFADAVSSLTRKAGRAIVAWLRGETDLDRIIQHLPRDYFQHGKIHVIKEEVC